ncbi:MAG UNVERIFIED_CONTAM: hypothetical protein LVT10_21455 [Anaerolineae bacterium]
MIFSAMLVAYLVFRIFNWEIVQEATEHLSIALVSLNTFILLASSWMMVMGSRAIQNGSNEGLVRWISGTAAFGRDLRWASGGGICRTGSITESC